MPSTVSYVLIFLSLIAVSYGDKSVGFPEWIADEYTGMDCWTEGVPKWIQGTFIHHQCGAFGGPKGSGRRSISHFYDCLGMLNAFRFDNGRVIYSSRYFDTTAFRSWSVKRRDSGSTSALAVSWRTLFTPIDQKSFDDQSAGSPAGQSNVDASPNGGVWSVDGAGCSLTAFSDAPKTYQVKLRNGQVQQLDNDADWTNRDLGPGLPAGAVVLHNSGHSHEDSDGNLWGVMLMARSKSAAIYEIFRLVYKIDAKTKRRKYFEGALPSKTVDLNMCSDDGRGSWTYRPDSLDEIGYVSEVATTTTYLILIENPYVFNPCALMDKARATPKPFLSTWFTWKGTQVPLKIHLIKKNDGTLKTTGSVPSAAFVSSTVNVAEGNRPQDHGYVVVDVVAHANADFLTKYFDVENLVSNADPWPADASLKRYAIDPNTGNVAQTESLLPPSTTNRISADSGTINRAWYGDGSYSYAYIMVRPFSDKSAIWKVDVLNNRPTLPWNPDTGVYPAGAPTYVPKSNETAATKEDDGVLLVPAFNSNTKKGLIVILDATNMKQIGRVDAPDLISYGTYSRFLPTCTDGAYLNRSSISLLLVSFLSVLILVGKLS